MDGAARGASVGWGLEDQGMRRRRRWISQRARYHRVHPRAREAMMMPPAGEVGCV